MHSTNYSNTLIEIAEDCAATGGEIPAVKGDKKSIANLQLEMLHLHPYGWRIHSNEEGKVALYAVDSEEYVQFVADDSVEKKKDIRSKRA